MTVALPPAPQFGAPVPQAPTPEVLRFLARRRSTSATKLAAPAPSSGELADLLRLAARAPDHGKLAPWRFIVLAGDDKTVFADRLEALALARGDQTSAAKLVKLRMPPMCIAVIAAPRAAAIPDWEQILSAGAVCTNLLYAAVAMGYGGNWITDWYAYDAAAQATLGLQGTEKVAGFIMLGTAVEAPMERERPDLEPLVSYWRA